MGCREEDKTVNVTALVTSGFGFSSITSFVLVGYCNQEKCAVKAGEARYQQVVESPT